MNFRFPWELEKRQQMVDNLQRELDQCRHRLMHERQETRNAKAQALKETRNLARTIKDTGVILAVLAIGRAMSRSPDTRGDTHE